MTSRPPIALVKRDNLLFISGIFPAVNDVYLENGSDLHLGTWHGKAVALGMLKQHVMREDERRVVAELDVAVELARDLMPNGVLIRAGLREIRGELLAGVMSPAVATMNAVHVLAHVTGVNASR